MTKAGNSQVMRTISLLITIFSLSFPAYAKYSGGTGEPNDPYHIAATEDLILLGESPEDYDKHFILTADIDLDPNLHDGQVFSDALIASDPENPYLENGGAFTGRFNGNNFSIRNIKIHSARGSLGVFGYIGEGGCVENLNVENAEIEGSSNIGVITGENWGKISNCTISGLINGQSYVGGIAGSNGNPGPPRCPCPYWKPQTGLIEKCYSECNIEGQTDVGGLLGINYRGSITSSWTNCIILGIDNIGGLIGKSLQGEISSCYALGNISGEYHVGGLVGENRSSSIFACYSQAEVTGSKYSAGLVGDNANGTIFCCYATGFVISEQEASGLASANDLGIIHSCFWDMESTGTAVSAGGEGKITEQMQSAITFDGWEFLEQWKIDEQNDYPRLIWEDSPGQPITDMEHYYSGGTGEPNSPYLIKTIEDLQTLSKYIGDWSKNYILVQDINLGNTQINSPAPIGLPPIPFTGIFDGNDHIINGLCYNIPNKEYVSLFRYVGYENADPNLCNGIICNLHLSDVNIVGTEYVSSLVGLNNGLIQSCSVTGDISSTGSPGGLVAENIGEISECSGNINVFRPESGSKGGDDIGGLIVRNEGLISNCSVCGIVDGASGASASGGLVGRTYGSKIINSYSSADIDGFWSAGGLVGSASGTEIICCYATGDVNSLESGDNADTGGLVGSMYGILVSSYSRGSVSGSGYVGSLVGQNGGTITSCYATGEVSGSGVLGGLVADDFLGTIYLSYWDSDSTRQNISAGGTGLTTDEMQTEITFTDAGWDFVDEATNGTEDIWWILEGQDYPRLWWEGSN